MKKLNLLFTALLLLCCLTAKAHDFGVGGIYYNIINATNKTVAVTYRGSDPDSYSNEYTGDVVIPESVTYNGNTYSVTSIGYGAFWYCTGLKSIEIPNSVTSIGYDAFEYCSSLTSVVIPNSVTSIGDYAFRGCSGLTSVEIPNSITSIGIRAFSGCSGLKTIINFSNLTFSKGTSSNGYIAYYADKVINAPDGFIDADFVWFENETGMTLAGYLGNVTELALPAEYNGKSVTSIGYGAFSDCTGLKSIKIPNSVTSIGEFAFRDCTGLSSIEIPNSVTYIGYYAFYGCTSLTSITIPNSVTSIGDYAFEGCTSLASVTIGAGVESIDREAFAKCSDLTDVYCLATSVPSTNATAFNESYPEYMTLHVPAEAIDSYKTTAPWSSFGTIVTLDGDVTETPKCATPTVLYSNGKLLFECETEGAEYVTDIKSNDIDRFYGNSINLSATYSISVYTMATGYENSETVNATLCWIECECDGSDDTGVINIPAKAALVTSNNGVLSISCQLDGEEVAVYTTAGMLIGTTTIDNGTATIATGLSKGTVAIVKIAEKSIKVAVN